MALIWERAEVVGNNAACIHPSANSVCEHKCLFHPRPIAGLINFCPGEVRKNKIEYMIDVAKHEIIHALVSYLLDVTCILKCIGYPSSNMRSIYII